jgi:hypothetical protein
VTARVQLVGKPGCHLCDEARRVISRLCADLTVGWEELDILGDPELADRYWEQIPVTLVDGAVVGIWYVDEAKVRRALAA